MGAHLPLLERPILAKLEVDVGAESAAFLIQSLKDEIRTGQSVLVQYAADDDMHQLETQAHALKSAARSFGALRLGAACMAIEEQARSATGKQVLGALLDEFGEVSAATLAAFEELDD